MAEEQVKAMLCVCVCVCVALPTLDEPEAKGWKARRSHTPDPQ